MTSLCVLTGGKILTLAISAFSLSWTHSVEKGTWRELWSVTPAGLALHTAMIKGSGAGMEPGDDAIVKDGWIVWHPKSPPLPSLSLAASGATVSDWKLCHANGCIDLGQKADDDTVLKPCPGP